MLPPPSSALWTALRYFATSRLLVAGLLLLFVMFTDPSQMFDSAPERDSFIWVASIYIGLAVLYLVALQPLQPRFYLQLLLHVLTDLVVLTTLVHFAGGLRSGLGVLCVATVAGAAVLSTPLLAGFFAAIATLLLLIESGLRSINGDFADVSALVPAGLIGAACFVTAYVVNWLAVRLERQERLARERGEDLRNQLAITQLVIAELQQGVLVVAPSGSIRTMNRAASVLLGVLPGGEFSLLAPGLQGAWAPLGKAFADWRAAPQPRLEAVELTLAPQLEQTVEHRIQVRFLSSGISSGESPRDDDGAAARTPAHRDASDTVLVIEDQRSIEERAQQLKLASMGRLSASIAHEIRNPLAAIRHANGLLAEQLQPPPLQRLAGIVETNTIRIDRIVEDVLSIARRESTAEESIDLQQFLPAFLPEFAASVGTGAERISTLLRAHEPLRFDANHLRQVLVNVLGNALRYASSAPGAVQIEWLVRTDDRLELSVADDGPGLTPDVLQHLFEPFFTTEARGTGLGLYLARELCHANGAAIRYERRFAGGRYRGAFVIEPHAHSAATGPLRS
jgi:two-component system, NtrC family, sensor histidine kinase PilS